MGTVQFWRQRAQRAAKGGNILRWKSKDRYFLVVGNCSKSVLQKMRRPFRSKENMKHQYFIFLFLLSSSSALAAPTSVPKRTRNSVHFSKKLGHVKSMDARNLSIESADGSQQSYA